MTAPPSLEARVGVERLTAAVLSLRALLDVLGTATRVAPVRPVGGEEGAEIGALLARIIARSGARSVDFLPGAQFESLEPFSQVVSRRLALGPDLGPAARLCRRCPAEVDRAIAEARAASFERRCSPMTVTSHDGIPLRAHAAGQRGRSAVVIATACGMPASICERWMKDLARRYFVLTWESRGLFGSEVAEGSLDCGLLAQVRDLFAMIDHSGVERVHLLGLCGGAVIALAAAARWPARVDSLSLWHGDLQLGSRCPQTSYQRNLRALMAMAAESGERAAAVHPVVQRSVCASARGDLAHLLLYPFATPELFALYSRLNGNLMAADLRTAVSQVRHPTLVVTSRDDTIAHPEGSRRVAAALADATLVETPHGDHVSLFQRPEDYLRRAHRFLSLSLP